MMMRHSLAEGTTVLEEFLGQQQQQQQQQQQPGEVHNRQESADSGLGMGSNFNLGSIPEVRAEVNLNPGSIPVPEVRTEVNCKKDRVEPTEGTW
jgi:hypothetical protein